MKVFVSAGEVSGDAILGAVLDQLLPQLGGQAPNLTLIGLGGPAAMAHGLAPIMPLERIAVSGVWDVLRRAPTLLRAYRAAHRLLTTSRPDLVLLVDYPGLNLRLAVKARKLGLPVLFIAPPQTWVYRRRAGKLRRAAEALRGCAVHVLFPFEAGDYSASAALVSQGHFWVTPEFAPAGLADMRDGDAAGGFPPRPDWRAMDREDILLCPGSRLPVIRRNLLAWLDALETLYPRPGLFAPPGRYGVLVPPGLTATVESFVKRHRAGRHAGNIQFQENRTEAFAHAQIALSFPGTMTMDLALARIPAVIVAVLDPLTLALGRRALASQRLALPNLLLPSEVFPEWFGVATDLTATVLSGLLDRFNHANFPWQNILGRLRDRMGEGQGAARAAESALQILAKTGKIPGSGA